MTIRLKNNIFDRWVFWAVMSLAILPFANIILLHLPGVILNAFELIWLFLIAVLLLKLLVEQKVKRSYLLLVFTFTVLLSIGNSAIISDVSIHAALVQLRNYLPFIVAKDLKTCPTLPTRPPTLPCLKPGAQA